jgi:PAS domain S-box-containing protein
MTSLPIPADWSQPLLPAASAVLENCDLLAAGAEDGKFLLCAFRSFSEAAGSLERSYGLLRVEVEQLRCELEETNADLAASLQENRNMRVHLDRILAGLPCGVLVVSSDGEITRTNPETLRLLGAEIRTGTLAVGLASALPAALRQLIEHANEKTTDDAEPEIRVPDENSGLRWLAVKRASITDGAESSSIFILRDISERKRFEEAQAKLRREQALAEMSSVLAHEIRNPLASLELFAGLLAESDLDGERRQWVEHVQAGLRTLAATVNNVLHFHSLPEPERAPLDLGQMLDWAHAFLAPLARQSRITLGSQNRLNGVYLAADRHRLEQVLLNLVLNAVRAMPGGGWIEIGGHSTADGRSVVLRVSDTGPGIAPEHLPSIFEPGFSTRTQSPGLGLAVCRKIVEQHGGTIRAVSRPGSGATFTITFPLAVAISSNSLRQVKQIIGDTE